VYWFRKLYSRIGGVAKNRHFVGVRGSGGTHIKPAQVLYNTNVSLTAHTCPGPALHAPSYLPNAASNPLKTSVHLLLFLCLHGSKYMVHISSSYLSSLFQARSTRASLIQNNSTTDSCLTGLQAHPTAASAFCAPLFIGSVPTAVKSKLIPAILSSCSGDGERLLSACSCLVAAPTYKTATPAAAPIPPPTSIVRMVEREGEDDEATIICGKHGCTIATVTVTKTATAYRFLLPYTSRQIADKGVASLYPN
jgi:hypothetical protein